MERDLSQMPSPREQYSFLVSWLAVLCQILEASLVVFLRRGFGARYLGGQALLVFPIVLVYSLFWPEHDPTEFVVFLALYLLACAWARIDGLRRRSRGEVRHSRYSGRPAVMDWPVFRGRLGEIAAKSGVEPLCVVLIAIGLMPFHEPLASYLIVGAIGQMFSVAFARAYERQRVMDARDAYIEQRRVAERFRDGD